MSSENTHSVMFRPRDVLVAEVPDGETLLRAAARADIHVKSPCGGTGACGKCLVKIESGQVQSRPSPHITPEEWQQGTRLACQSTIVEDLVVSIPDATSAEPISRLPLLELDELTSPVGPLVDPPVRCLVVELAPPDPSDRRSDLERLRSALEAELVRAMPDPAANAPRVLIPLEVVQTLPELLRSSDWRVGVAFHNADGCVMVQRVMAADAMPESLVVAVDLGTTTVWGELLDGLSGRRLASAGSLNRQIAYGDDVISRMVRAAEEGGAERLQAAASSSINDVLDQLTMSYGTPGDGIDRVVIAGNSTMTSLLLGVETKHLRLEPYVPPLDSTTPVSAEGLGLSPVARGATLQVLPLVGSYVGGDVVAGVLASRMAESERLSLYMDLGTNGETVLGNKDWLLAASCSAGPAFEGGGLRHGMRASAGAIETVTIDRQTLEPSVLTIEDAAPLGICGSGVIDAVAELFRSGVLLPSGRFNTEIGAPGLREGEGIPHFVLVPGAYSETGEDIVLSETDVDNVLRAKAAMFAGVSTLLRTVDVEWEDLERIIVSGAFGRHLRLREAMAIGLFPSLDPERFEFIGNGSLAGARAVALSSTSERRAREVASLMNNIELSDNSLFQEEYMAAMFLPHTDSSRWSV